MGIMKISKTDVTIAFPYSKNSWISPNFSFSLPILEWLDKFETNIVDLFEGLSKIPKTELKTFAEVYITNSFSTLTTKSASKAWFSLTPFAWRLRHFSLEKSFSV